MERLTPRSRNILTIAALSATALVSCSVDSYLTDPSNVHCDGKRTKTELDGDGIAEFIVHGNEDDKAANVNVRLTDDGVSVRVSGDVTGPPQQLGKDGYTEPVPAVKGPELSTFGAGGVWTVDVSPKDGTVSVRGTCDGM